eukprot:CAMPEP_0194747732 /NCGR_PEP_ID=MMETSP0323_2-20130528/1903_1 /TAXON_ID=2866 ORGANISM="Crypthecodinium cohnii, Strain Seligo" /NCGR_SAMPLE_ID=MMETSP0323_2 /ASSEMBLY_ACC=CAM_ASM_000346 /LENGTH=212 /DNA_ID=CAMNT_0039661421 /DNA_START=375 /DNA_END=1014 /DNA_ORIENTATION=+
MSGLPPGIKRWISSCWSNSSMQSDGSHQPFGKLVLALTLQKDVQGEVALTASKDLCYFFAYRRTCAVHGRLDVVRASLEYDGALLAMIVGLVGIEADTNQGPSNTFGSNLSRFVRSSLDMFEMNLSKSRPAGVAEVSSSCWVGVAKRISSCAVPRLKSRRNKRAFGPTRLAARSRIASGLLFCSSGEAASCNSTITGSSKGDNVGSFTPFFK